MWQRVLIGVCLWCAASAWADADRADLEPNDVPQNGDTVAWKLSLGRYKDSINGYANDVNLRGSTGDLSFWVAQYQDASHYTQTRSGIEKQSPLPLGRLISSLQSASGGFVGGSVTWDLRQNDDQWFAPMVGWGRTDGKTYYNLTSTPTTRCWWAVPLLHRTMVWSRSIAFKTIAFTRTKKSPTPLTVSMQARKRVGPWTCFDARGAVMSMPPCTAAPV